jgi:hypothetical protein
LEQNIYLDNWAQQEVKDFECEVGKEQRTYAFDNSGLVGPTGADEILLHNEIERLDGCCRSVEAGSHSIIEFTDPGRRYG